MKNMFLLIAAFAFCNVVVAQNILWSRSQGGTLRDQPGGMGNTHTTDGGYIYIGSSASNDGDVTGHHGTSSLGDIWVVKTDSNGYIDWEKSFGGTADDQAGDILQTSDGGYIFCGATQSNDGDVIGNHGLYDVWIVKLDATGTIQWQKCFGGSAQDFYGSLLQTNDGGYIFAAETVSNDGDVSGQHNSATNDIWLVRLNSSGTLIWQSCVGGTAGETVFTNSLQTLYDGNYLITASTNSTDGDVTNNHGMNDIWLVKINDSGTIIWQKTFGGIDNDGGNNVSAKELNGGGYLIASSTNSPVGGDVSSRVDTVGDMWLIKSDDAGNIIWDKTFGGNGVELGGGIVINNNQYYILGTTMATDLDASSNHGIFDMIIVATDTAGNKLWSRCYGGSSADFFTDAVANADGGITFVGLSGSNDGDVSGHHGAILVYDTWLVRIGTAGNFISETAMNISNLKIFPNPVSENASISFYNSTEQQLQISIADALGREVKIIASQNCKPGNITLNFDASDFENGIYFLNIVNGNSKSNSTFVIQH